MPNEERKKVKTRKQKNGINIFPSGRRKKDEIGVVLTWFLWPFGCCIVDRDEILEEFCAKSFQSTYSPFFSSQSEAPFIRMMRLFWNHSVSLLLLLLRSNAFNLGRPACWKSFTRSTLFLFANSTQLLSSPSSSLLLLLQLIIARVQPLLE